MREIKEVLFFPNGNTAVCDEKGQIPELQKSWFLMFVDFLKSKDIKVDKNIIFNMPNGKVAEYMPEFNNWQFKS